ncbi:ArsR/SmtB family transcription factor [Pseudonocardia acaciae]|uniref:ArsR/SmtB family transcription factor n=1 Tax=Pseudonocardia acaciae TaxID=551276 RepID=UPI0004921BDA|nr:helix-turn-helix domain-containing protein [Pseudonocardia acaciae]
MADRPARRDVADLEALKALAQPRRQRILQHLNLHGPATSATLARALGLNTGATSYHLRELARHGFVAEMPERAQGKQRWWRYVRADIRFPPRGEQDAATRAVMDELASASFAQDLRTFAAARERADAEPDGWADAFPFSHGTIRVTERGLAEFFEEYIALLNRYREPPPEDEAGGAGEARTIVTRFFAFPAPR